ncbi:hypothetical protein ACLOJK_007929 [Asimina triloba]
MNSNDQRHRPPNFRQSTSGVPEVAAILDVDCFRRFPPDSRVQSLATSQKIQEKLRHFPLSVSANLFTWVLTTSIELCTSKGNLVNLVFDYCVYEDKAI